MSNVVEELLATKPYFADKKLPMPRSWRPERFGEHRVLVPVFPSIAIGIARAQEWLRYPLGDPRPIIGVEILWECILAGSRKALVVLASEHATPQSMDWLTQMRRQDAAAILYGAALKGYEGCLYDLDHHFRDLFTASQMKTLYEAFEMGDAEWQRSRLEVYTKLARDEAEVVS